MSYPIQSFSWRIDGSDGWEEITPNLEKGVAQTNGEDGDSDLLVTLEFADRKAADLWSPTDEISVQFTLQEHTGVVEGTAEITRMTTSLDRKAHHRVCHLHLRPKFMNTDSEKFPAELR